MCERKRCGDASKEDLSARDASARDMSEIGESVKVVSVGDISEIAKFLDKMFSTSLEPLVQKRYMGFCCLLLNDKRIPSKRLIDEGLHLSTVNIPCFQQTGFENSQIDKNNTNT